MVDLPAPTPLRGIAASQQPQPRAADGATRKVSKEMAENVPPKHVSLARELASEPAPVDHARVARIQAAIRSGSYRADPEQIARAILKNG